MNRLDPGLYYHYDGSGKSTTLVLTRVSRDIFQNSRGSGFLQYPPVLLFYD